MEFPQDLFLQFKVEINKDIPAGYQVDILQRDLGSKVQVGVFDHLFYLLADLAGLILKISAQPFRGDIYQAFWGVARLLGEVQAGFVHIRSQYIDLKIIKVFAEQLIGHYRQREWFFPVSASR